MECEKNKVYPDNYYSLILYSIVEKFTVIDFFAHWKMNLSRDLGGDRTLNLIKIKTESTRLCSFPLYLM